jgi:hypothetical protein
MRVMLVVVGAAALVLRRRRRQVDPDLWRRANAEVDRQQR